MWTLALLRYDHKLVLQATTCIRCDLGRSANFDPQCPKKFPIAAQQVCVCEFHLPWYLSTTKLTQVSTIAIACIPWLRSGALGKHVSKHQHLRLQSLRSMQKSASRSYCGSCQKHSWAAESTILWNLHKLSRHQQHWQQQQREVGKGQSKEDQWKS